MSRRMRLLCAVTSDGGCKRQAAQVVRGRDHVHMRVDQAGQHDAPAGVDDARHVVDLQRLVADGDDALALDDDLAARAQPAARRCRRPWRCGSAGAASGQARRQAAAAAQMRRRAASYSRFSRATSSPPAPPALTAPMPWPQPQMSFQALLRPAVAAELHRADVAFGQVVRVQPGVADRRLQVVAVHAGEQVGIDDVVAAAVDDASACRRRPRAPPRWR